MVPNLLNNLGSALGQTLQNVGAGANSAFSAISQDFNNWNQQNAQQQAAQQTQMQANDNAIRNSIGQGWNNLIQGTGTVANTIGQRVSNAIPTLQQDFLPQLGIMGNKGLPTSPNQENFNPSVYQIPVLGGGFRMADNMLDSPAQSYQGAQALGNDIANQINGAPGTQATLPQWLGSAAEAASLPLNIATFGEAAPLEAAGQLSIKELLAMGAVSGLKWGTIFGAQGGLEQNAGVNDPATYIKNLAISTVEGTGMGLGLGIGGVLLFHGTPILVRQGKEVVQATLDNFNHPDVQAAIQGQEGKIKLGVGDEIPPTTPETTPQATQMYSNNQNDLNFQQALDNLNSPEHQQFSQQSEEINNKYQAPTISRTNLLGDTKSYGTENSIMDVIQTDAEKSRLIAAEKGLAGNQLTVLNFVHDPNGVDAMVTLNLPKDLTLNQIRAIMDAAGLEYRSINPADNSVIVFDQGGKNIDTISKLAEQYGTTIKTQFGTGEFIGSDTSRDSAKQVYQGILSEAQSASGSNPARISNTDNGLPAPASEPTVTPTPPEPVVPVAATGTNPPEAKFLDNTPPLPKDEVPVKDLTMEQKTALDNAAKTSGGGKGSTNPFSQSAQDVKSMRQNIQNTLRGFAAKYNVDRFLNSQDYKPDVNFFNKMSKTERLEFLQRAEQGLPQPTPELQAAADHLKAQRDADYMIMQSVNPNIPYNASSFSRVGLWRDPKSAEAFYFKYMQDQTLKGAVDAEHGRVFPTIYDGIQAGLGIKETNPAIMAYNARVQALRLKMASDFMQSAADQGADPIIVNDIIQQYLDPGLSKFGWYNTIRGISNTVNQLNLFGGFHFGTTAINAAVSKAGIGLGQIFGVGRAWNPVKGIGNIITSPTAGLEYLFRGQTIFDKLKSGDLGNEAVNNLVQGGFRFQMPENYDALGFQKAVNDLMSGGWTSLKGAVELPFGVLNSASKPLMSWWVPRMKTGAAIDLMDSELAKLPKDATPEMVKQTQASVIDSIDNRFGQMNQDNLFWNSTIKDLMGLAMRSPGWNIGTVRELGGGALDLLNVRRALSGQGLTSRAEYMLALPVVIGTMGASYMYLHTGHGPQSLVDYFFPQTGETLASGQPERVSFPSYAKDVYAFFHNPIQTMENKGNPIISQALEGITNKDYFGNDIRDTSQPVDVQAKQFLAHELQANLPFSLSSGQNRINPDAESGLESALGVTKAPGSITGGFYATRDDMRASLNSTQQKVWDYYNTPSSQGGPTSKQKAALLFANGNEWLLGKVKDLENKTSPNDPLWSQPIDKIQAYLAYQTGTTAQRAQLLISNPGIPQLQWQISQAIAASIAQSKQTQSQQNPLANQLSYGLLGVQPATTTEKPPVAPAGTYPTTQNPQQQLTPQQVQAAAAYTAANAAGNATEKYAILAANPWLKSYWNANAAYYQANPVPTDTTASPLNQYLTSQGIPLTTPTTGGSPYNTSKGIKFGTGFGKLKSPTIKKASTASTSFKIKGLKTPKLTALKMSTSKGRTALYKAPKMPRPPKLTIRGGTSSLTKPVKAFNTGKTTGLARLFSAIASSRGNSNPGRLSLNSDGFRGSRLGGFRGHLNLTPLGGTQPSVSQQVANRINGIKYGGYKFGG